MRKRRLLWHLYPSYLVITVAALLAVSWYTLRSMHDLYYKQATNDLLARARLVEQQILPVLRRRNFEDVDSICKTLGRSSETRITVILPEGRVVGDSDEAVEHMGSHGDRPEFKDALANGFGKSLRSSDTLGKRMMYLAVVIDAEDVPVAVARTSIPVTAIDEVLERIYRRIILVVLVVGGLAAGVSLVVARRISHPIEQMKETAKSFASGQLHERAPISSSAELAELAIALNEMAEQLHDKISEVTRQRNESEAILSGMVEGVLAVDSQGCVVIINKAGAKFLRVSSEQAQGRKVEEVIQSEYLRDFITNTLKSEEVIETDILPSREDGRCFQLHGASLTDSGGNRTGAVIVMNDMTRMRNLEEIRRDFVSNVSHELKTPITSIKGFVETLLEGAISEPEQAERFLRIVAKHADRLNAIIEDLLSLSSLEEDSEKRRILLEQTDLRAVLLSAIELSAVKAEDKRIELKLECDGDIWARVNTALLEQAVTNLVDNAIKYSESGGEVCIGAVRKDDEILISVRDDGCGIEEQQLSRIFERFYVVDKGRSRKLGGTGLGLAIVKHIAQVHGGYVTVESTVGAGSNFTIHLVGA